MKENKPKLTKIIIIMKNSIDIYQFVYLNKFY
jgi:hypothetical protein